MNRSLVALLCLSIFFWCSGCNSSSASTSPSGIVVHVSGSFTTIAIGGAPVTLTASVSGASGNQGVNWNLSVANTSCSPTCGTLKGTATSAVYTPPSTLPLNQTATITASSIANNSQIFAFNFLIVPPISVSITNKFSSQTAGGPVANISATITNDLTNAGLSWTLTAGGASCVPATACGTLTVDPAPSLTAHYQPPAAPPTGANASPTITATSVADPTKNDSFSFTIGAPPISVTIINKTSSQAVGGPAVTFNVSIVNDFTNAGATWSLTAAGAACTPAAACGTLVQSPAPSLSAVYTPPAALPTGANTSPTITATSVADTTKSDSFTFSIVAASALFMGDYALLLRGYDSAGNPMAIAGSITSNGSGSITGGELDLNDNGTITSVPAPLAGSYTLDTSFNGVPRVSISLTLPSGTMVLKGTLSSDGKRARVIELDGSFALNAGTLLQQDPAALSAANPAGSYAFGLDSDAGSNAGVTGRIVEAGQFVLGTGGTSVTAGLADAGQAAAPSPLFGGLAGAAPLDLPASSATAPDSSGRGRLTLSFAGHATQYAYYVVNAQQLNLIEIDTGGTFHTAQAGTAQLQQTLTANSINATSVAALTGVTTVSGAPVSDVIIGVLSVTGTTPSVVYDGNSSGGIILTAINGTGSILSPFDPTTGRTVMANTFFVAAVYYYYDTGKAYIVDVTPVPNGANHALSGQMVPQAAPPFSQTEIFGNCIAGSGGSSIPANPAWDMAVNFDGVSSFTAEGDLVTTNTALGNNGEVANFQLGATYRIDDTTHGRGEILKINGPLLDDPTASDKDNLSFYLIGPNQFVAISETPTIPSGIIFFDPQ